MNIPAPMLQAIAERNLHVRNIIVRKHGEIVARHDFQPDTPHLLYSVSKGFASIAIGMAWSERLLRLDDSIALYLPRAKDHAGFDKILIRHLLTMSTGHAACPIESKRGVTDIESEFYKEPLVCAPGETFVYNNAASYLLSKIITKVTGMSLLDYLMPRLFAPLGIAKPRWDADSEGINFGFSHLYLTAEQLSLVAQVLLDGGKYRGRQLIPEEYVRLASSKQISTENLTEAWTTPDSHAGYGFQLWQNSRAGSCRFDGYLGQYAVIIPDSDMVVTYISDEHVNMLGILALTWEFLC